MIPLADIEAARDAMCGGDSGPKRPRARLTAVHRDRTGSVAGAPRCAPFEATTQPVHRGEPGPGPGPGSCTAAPIQPGCECDRFLYVAELDSAQLTRLETPPLGRAELAWVR